MIAIETFWHRILLGGKKNVTPQAWREALSLTPRFIVVEANKPAVRNGFNRFPSPDKQTVKTVRWMPSLAFTAMSRGVNEILSWWS